MNCINCDSKIKEGMLVCPICGEEISSEFKTMETEENTYEKVNDVNLREKKMMWMHAKKKMVLCIGGSVVGVILLILLLLPHLSLQKRIMVQLENGYFERARETYNNCEDEDKDVIATVVEEYCEKTLAEFNETSIEHNMAKDSIISAENIIGITSFREKLSKLKASKNAYEQGVEHIESEEWEKATSEFKKVIKEDTNYQESMDALLTCEEKIRLETKNSLAAFEKAQEFQSEEKWLDAMKEYKKVSEYTPDEYQKAEEQSKVCFEEYKTIIYEQLNECFTMGDYEKGLNIISSAEQNIPNDETLEMYRQNFIFQKEEMARIQEENKYNTGITYDQLARNPEYYKGAYVKFSGRVLQVVSEDEFTGYRINVSGYRYSDNVIMAIQQGTNTVNRILEDDYVTVRGKAGGLYTYQTVMGNTLSIPCMAVDYIER